MLTPNQIMQQAEDSMQLINEIMQTLTQELIRTNTLYRQGHQSGMSDPQYDRAEKALEHLEAAYPQFVNAQSPVGKVDGGYKF